MSDDLSAIKLALGDRVEELGRDLFGKPSSRSRSEIRYGRKGSKCFRRKWGRWSFSDFETGEGGSLLDAIRVAHNTNFLGALAIAKSWLGWSDDQAAEQPKVLVPPAPKVVDEPNEDAEKLAAAQAIWRAAGPIGGTPAEAYLISRGIEHWPDGPIRFHPKLGIVFAATNSADEVRAVQHVVLDEKGSPARRPDGSKIKISRGPQAGVCVRFPGPTDCPVIAAEGPETGLSIWSAMSGQVEVRIALGAVDKLEFSDVEPARLILVARDDDPVSDDDPQKDRQRKARVEKIANSINELRRSGRSVASVWPWGDERRGDKSDFNDLLVQCGPEAVRERVEAAFAVGDQAETVPWLKPFHEVDRRPIEAVRGGVRDVVASFLDGEVVEFQKTLVSHADAVAVHKIEKAEWKKSIQERRAAFPFVPEPTAPIPPTPPVIGARISAGAGKTTEAIRALIDRLASGQISKAILALPAHVAISEKLKLAKDYARESGAKVLCSAWYGREQPSPVDPKRKVCDNFELYSEFVGSGGDGREFCKQCSYADSCYALLQARMQAQLWIVPTAMLTTALPKPLRGADALFIDEDLVGSLVFGVSAIGEHNSRPISVPKSLCERRWLSGTSADAQLLLSGVLTAVSGLLSASEGLPYLRLDAFSLTPPEVAEARRILWSTKQEITIDADISVDDLKANKSARWNRDLRKLAALLSAIEDALELGLDQAGRISVKQSSNDEAGDFLVAEVSGLKRLSKAARAIPTLRLDATLSEEIERQIFPSIEFREPLEAETPHMRVVWCPSSGAKSSVTVTDQISEREASTRRNRLEAVRHLLEAMAATSHRGTLLITYKQAREELERLGLLNNVQAMHFKAQRGLDSAGSVDTALIYGRTRPNERSVERIAAAISGRAVESGDFELERRNFEMADGSVAGVDVERHPDPFADQVLQFITDAELIQSIGRVRGLNRTACDPVTVFVVANRVPPVVIDELVEWRDLVPSRVDVAMAREGGALALSPADLAERHPDLWQTAEAARSDVKRGGAESYWGKLLYGLLIGVCPINSELPTGTFRKRGQRGPKPSRFVASPVLTRKQIRRLLRDQAGPEVDFRGLERWAAGTVWTERISRFEFREPLAPTARENRTLLGLSHALERGVEFVADWSGIDPQPTPTDEQILNAFAVQLAWVSQVRKGDSQGQTATASLAAANL